MGILTQIFGLLLSLSILVVLHELGHFTFAKLFKTRVEKFYLFFNPWFSLFKFKKGDTEYGIGWLPLGGFVKISGMIDESMDKEQLSKPPQPWEFRSKPTWQRLLIMVGGVMVNFVLALVIYAMIFFTWGTEYIPASEATYGARFDSLALEIGFQHGDKVLKIDDYQIEKYQEIAQPLILGEVSNISVDRDGKIINVAIPADFGQRMLANKVRNFVDECRPFIVDTIIPEGNAAKSELRKGDIILAINDISTPDLRLFRSVTPKHKGEEVIFTVERNKEFLKIPITVSDKGLIGVGYSADFSSIFNYKKQDYTLTQAIPAGIDHGIATLTGYVKSMKLIFTKEGAQSIGGFGTIGGLFPKSWNWSIFWERTALLSLILAFMNILPIPALDGGHVMFLMYEMVTGRKPGDKFLEYAQMVGMVLLLGLLLYANLNDIFRL